MPAQQLGEVRLFAVVFVPEEQRVDHPARPVPATVAGQAVGARGERFVGVAGQQRVGELVKGDQDLAHAMPTHTADWLDAPRTAQGSSRRTRGRSRAG